MFDFPGDLFFVWADSEFGRLQACAYYSRLRAAKPFSYTRQDCRPLPSYADVGSSCALLDANLEELYCLVAVLVGTSVCLRITKFAAPMRLFFWGALTGGDPLLIFAISVIANEVFIFSLCGFPYGVIIVKWSVPFVSPTGRSCALQTPSRGLKGRIIYTLAGISHACVGEGIIASSPVRSTWVGLLQIAMSAYGPYSIKPIGSNFMEIVEDAAHMTIFSCGL